MQVKETTFEHLRLGALFFVPYYSEGVKIAKLLNKELYNSNTSQLYLSFKIYAHLPDALIVSKDKHCFEIIPEENI